MNIHSPSTLDEVLGILHREPGALCLAGGATLVAMMNARLVEPETLVSLRHVGELAGIVALGDGTLRIGAMTRHRVTASEPRLAEGRAVVRDAARHIANPTVRNMGTMGGSIGFADPAADYPPALVAAGAIVEIAGSTGRRTLPVEDFFVDWYMTALEPGEIVTGILIPPAAPGSVGLYDKLSRVEDDYATVSVAVVLAMEGARCREVRIAVGGCGPKPVRVEAAEALLVGSELSSARLQEAGAMLADASDPVDDVRGTAAYRRRVIPGMVRRAVLRAAESVKNNAKP